MSSSKASMWWDWIQEEGSLLLPIYFPKNFQEYLQILWEHTSSSYLFLILASVFLILATLALTKTITDDKAETKKSFDEDAVRSLDMGDPNVISRIKKAQSRIINQKITQNMSSEEVQKEQEIQQEQLSQIYSLLKEHEKDFGDVSMEDLKGQMSTLYKD